MIRYWLMKSEPTTYSIDALIKAPQHSDHWEGVRNYQARNYLRDTIKTGDRAFFYHSNCEVPGIAGTMEIVREHYPDMTALNPDSPYYDPKSTPDNPRWWTVTVRFLEKFNTLIPLSVLKTLPPLEKMILLKPGNRLSVMPVSQDEWNFILSLALRK